MIVVVYIVTAFGLAYILGQSVISRPLREWAFNLPGLRWLVVLVECPACCGFWIGFISSLVVLHTIHLDASWYEKLAIAILGGCFTTGSNFVIGRATGVIANPRKEE